MKKLIFSLAIIAILLSALSACQPAPATITVGAEDAGRTVKLYKGDTLVIALEGNPTTGYTWIPAAQDPALLSQVGDVEVTPQSEAPGAGGTVVLHFNAVAQGQTVFKLEYKRSWETDVTPEKTFEITVLVR